MEEFTALAIGAFDGLHKGHLKLIEKAKEEKTLKTAVLSFKENPSLSLTGKASYLLTQKDKEKILKENAEVISFIDFDEVKNISPENFFTQYIVKKCRAKKIFCGDNFRFGKNAKGDVNLLQKLANENNIDVEILDYELYDGEIISSTRIRNAVQKGEMQDAKNMLGRYFAFCSKVVKGKQIGRTLGTPTVNQEIPENFTLPKFGVYASFVTLEGKKYFGVTNVGTKPSLGKNEPNCETWILDFDKDIYGVDIKVELIEFIRAEKKFNSLDDLKEQIIKDVSLAKFFCEKYK